VQFSAAFEQYLVKYCSYTTQRLLMKKFVFFSAVVLVSCTQKGDQPPGGAPGAGARTSYNIEAIEGYRVKPMPLAETVTASGTILPAEETALHPEASGRVISFNLPEGKTVSKGALLLKLFDEDLQTQVRKLELQLKQAEITEQRLGDLLKVKGVSQQEYDLAALQVQTLRSEIELVRINIRKTEIRAPYDGVIGLRKVSPGAYVTPADVIATIRATNSLKLDFAIPEKYSSLLRPGQKITFTVEGQSTPYSAVVLATEQSIATDTRNLRIRAEVQGRQSGLLPGAFAEVALNMSSKTNALLVPSQSLVPQARDKRVYVSRNGVAGFVPVKTGVRQAGMVEITEGLQEGDTIATTGILFLRPEAPMRFSKVQ
jgi:membrane fusion protein (multidrug efflux system)